MITMCACMHQDIAICERTSFSWRPSLHFTAALVSSVHADVGSVVLSNTISLHGLRL